ncbi:MAG TPA: hypothetical protein VMB48_10995 [Steroidobacteraceae bacterium]|nr:hypothetical protein [Steroidobacteraceae bacterium]
MIEEELQLIARQGPDRSLESLEAHVWAAVARRERAMGRVRDLLFLQGAVLLCVLAGSVLAGRELGRQQAPNSPNSLAVFSTHLLLDHLSAWAAPGGQP